jgi:WD40 repeat protein
MTIMKTIFKAWIFGVLAIFGVLIVGFLGWTVWKAAVQPRAAAQTTCAFESSCLYTVVNGSRSVRLSPFSNDGQRLMSKGSSTLIHDAATGNRVGRLNPSFDSFTAVFMSERREIAAIGREAIEFFDYDGELLRTWRADPDERTAEFVPLPQLDGFALAQEDAIVFYRMSDGSRFSQLPDSPGMSQLAVSADGALLAAYSAAADAIHLWPLERIADAVIISEAGQARHLQLSADGSLVAAHSENSAFVWRTADGALLGAVDAPDVAITALSLAANGARLAVGYADGIVEVWSLPQGELVQFFEHGQQLNGVALSPDGARLAVGLRETAVVTRITAQERREAEWRARTGQAGDNTARFLTPGQTYVDTKPGFAIVWAVDP